MVVLSFDECVAETEAEMKMHVEVAAYSFNNEDSTAAAPVKAVVYWLNSHTGYFMAPGTTVQLYLYSPNISR